MPEFQLLCKTAGTSEQEQHLTGDFRCYFGTEVLIFYHYLPPNFFFCALKLNKLLRLTVLYITEIKILIFGFIGDRGGLDEGIPVYK